MKKTQERTPTYGAMVERGQVETANEGAYTVRSLDRDGIVTPEIGAISGTYTAGGRVYFFLYPDGTGAIIGAM